MLPFRFPSPPVEQYESTSAAQAWLMSVIALSERWFDSGGSFTNWLESYQSLRDELCRLCWERFLPADVRTHVAYILLGSAARGEDLFSSDLDFAILHDSKISFDDIHPHLQNFILAMRRFGVPPCQGFVMGTNRRWIGTFDDWMARIEQYFSFPDWENSRYLFMLVDSRVQTDANDSWQVVRNTVFDRIRNSPFICWEMAHLGIHRTTAIDVRGLPRLKRVNQELVFPVKEGLLNTLIHCIRLLCIGEQCRMLPTTERLRCLRQLGVLDDAVLDELEQALEFGWKMRLIQQLEDAKKPAEQTDAVVWNRLTLAEQEVMKRHLRTTKSLERHVHRLFRKPG